MPRRIWAFILGLAVLSLAFAACGGDDDDSSGDDDGGLSADQQAAVDYMETFVALYNDGDYEGWVAEFTESGLRAMLGDEETPFEDLQADVPSYFEGEPPLEGVTFSDVEAAGDSATVAMTSTSENVIDKAEYTLVKEGGDFQVNGYTDLPEDLPEGVTPLAVSAADFAFAFEGGDAADGVQAVSFTNEGEQSHQLLLLNLDGGPELDSVVGDLMEAEDPGAFPDYVEDFAGTMFAPPGGEDGVLFAEPLDAGRYVLICLLPDQTQGEDGPPHASLGMVAEFTVE